MPQRLLVPIIAAVTTTMYTLVAMATSTKSEAVSSGDESPMIDSCHVEFFPRSSASAVAGDTFKISFAIVCQEKESENAKDPNNRDYSPFRNLASVVFRAYSITDDFTHTQMNSTVIVPVSDVMTGTNFSFSLKALKIGFSSITWTLSEGRPRGVQKIQHRISRSHPSPQRSTHAADALRAMNPRKTKDKNETALTMKYLRLSEGEMTVNGRASTLKKGRQLLKGNYVVSVIRQSSIDQKMLLAIIVLMVCVDYFNMGCQIHLNTIKTGLKSPAAIAIGLLSQLLYMPMASYGLGYLLLDDITWKLGFFFVGCSPCATTINFWTLQLKGDLDLSETLTLFSTLTTLGIMPLWLLTLGSNLVEKDLWTISFDNLFLCQAGLTAPLGLGFFVQRYLPSWIERSRRLMNPFHTFCLVFILMLGTYSNAYIFQYFSWQMICVSAVIAWGGYILGALVAWAACLSKPKVTVVAIGTALQNGGISFVLLKMSFPEPAADLTVVPLMILMILSAVPLWLNIGVMTLEQCLREPKPKNKIQSKESFSPLTFHSSPSTSRESKCKCLIAKKTDMQLVTTL